MTATEVRRLVCILTVFFFYVILDLFVFKYSIDRDVETWISFCVLCLGAARPSLPQLDMHKDVVVTGIRYNQDCLNKSNTNI